MLSQKSTICSPCPAPQPTHSCFLTLTFPCTGAYNLQKTKGLSFHWWPSSPSSATFAARDTSSGLVSSYCCSSYRIADPFSSLGLFSSCFTGDPVLSLIVGWEHPPLYLSDNGGASQKTAITSSYQQALAGIHKSFWVWWLYMGWIPRWGSLWMVIPSVSAPHLVSVYPPVGILFPLLRRTKYLSLRLREVDR